MTMPAYHNFLMQVREEFACLTEPGRVIGEAIAEDASATKMLCQLPGISSISQLGLEAQDCMARRVAIYEMLGYADPNVAAAAPGPVMTGFVMHSMADTQQFLDYQDLFSSKPSWSCFALTEKHSGTDASALLTRAIKIDDGWSLSGQKYMVGQGVTADYVVLFARTASGPLGVEAFGFKPSEVTGYCAERLPITGLAGTNLSKISLNGMLLPHNAHLGAHLKPAERARRSVSATLDAMRPCLGAVALGHCRAVLDRAIEDDIVSAQWCACHHHRLEAALNWGLRIAFARNEGRVLAREAGLMKQNAISVTEDIFGAFWTKVSPSALRDHSWLRRAWRDAAAFEYMEGISAVHRINASDAFRLREGQYHA